MTTLPHALHPGAIQGKEAFKFCHLATLDLTWLYTFPGQVPKGRAAPAYLDVSAEVVGSDVDERLAVLEAELAELPPLGLGSGGYDHDVHLGDRDLTSIRSFWGSKTD